LLGLVQHVAFQHVAEVERNCFRRVLTGESVPAIHCPGADPEGPNSGFELAEGANLADALATWEAETLQARANWKGRELGATSAFMAAEVTLRWICIHIIANMHGMPGTPIFSANASTDGLAFEPASQALGVSSLPGRSAFGWLWGGLR